MVWINKTELIYENKDAIQLNSLHLARRDTFQIGIIQLNSILIRNSKMVTPVIQMKNLKTLHSGLYYGSVGAENIR
jgi:hypothetical protein